MASGAGERSALAPTCHASINETRVAGEDDVRPQSQPLHDAGAKALDQGVSLVEEVQHARGLPWIFQVHGNARAASRDDPLRIGVRALRAVETNELRAHVGKQHAREWARADAREFDDPKARKRS